jgi:hypothetical protein
MTESKGCEEGASERRGGSVKKRESVIRVESEEKVEVGGLRGDGGQHISSSVMASYSSYIQSFYTVPLYSI